MFLTRQYKKHIPKVNRTTKLLEILGILDDGPEGPVVYVYEVEDRTLAIKKQCLMEMYDTKEQCIDFIEQLKVDMDLEDSVDSYILLDTYPDAKNPELTTFIYTDGNGGTYIVVK